MKSPLHAQASRTAGALVQGMVRLGFQLLEIERTQAYVEFGCSSVRHYAASALGLSGREVAHYLKVARRLAELPGLLAAVKAGKLGWSALRLLCDHVTPEDEARWLEVAQVTTPQQLEELIEEARAGSDGAAVLVRWRLAPKTADLIHQAWRRLSEQAGRSLTRDEALQQMSLKVLSSATQAQPPVGKKSRVRFNPATRMVTEAQRAELMKRDRYRCCVPGCDNRLWLHVHHLKYHCRGGATVPENLVVLCSACHRLIHAGKLRVVGEAPGSLVFSDVHGRRLGEFVPYELRPG